MNEFKEAPEYVEAIEIVKDAIDELQTYFKGSTVKLSIVPGFRVGDKQKFHIQAEWGSQVDKFISVTLHYPNAYPALVSSFRQANSRDELMKQLSEEFFAHEARIVGLKVLGEKV